MFNPFRRLSDATLAVRIVYLRARQARAEACARVYSDYVDFLDNDKLLDHTDPDERLIRFRHRAKFQRLLRDERHTISVLERRIEKLTNRYLGTGEGDTTTEYPTDTRNEEDH